MSSHILQRAIPPAAGALLAAGAAARLCEPANLLLLALGLGTWAYSGLRRRVVAVRTLEEGTALIAFRPLRRRLERVIPLGGGLVGYSVNPAGILPAELRPVLFGLVQLVVMLFGFALIVQALRPSRSRQS